MRCSHCMSAAISNETAAKNRVVGKPFVKGKSGNPRGRPCDELNMQKLARSYTRDAIITLVEALKSPRNCVPAAVALLDRGWGKPHQMIHTDIDSNISLHLIAARVIAKELLDEHNGKPTIDHASQPQHSLAHSLDQPDPAE